MSATILEQQRKIFIGKKSIMSYVLPVMDELAHNGQVALMARGATISRAVDAAEVVKRLGANFEVKSISIDTEKLGEGNEIRNVSTISIVMGLASH